MNPGPFRLSLFAFRLTVFFLSLFPLLLSNPAVVYAQWEPDVRLTYDDSASWTSYNNTRCIASEPNGNVRLVWQDSRDGNPEIYYKYSTDSGVTWSSDMRLTNNPYDSWGPSISISGTYIHLSWWDNRPGNFEIYYKRSTDWGGSWSPDTRLSNAPGYSEFPSIAVIDSFVHIVWNDIRDGNREIYYRRSSNNGDSWSSETRLTNAPYDSWAPSISTSGASVHLAWWDARDGPYKVYYKRSTDAGTTWSQDTALSDSQAAPQNPSIHTSGAFAHLVWDDLRDGNREIYYKCSSDGGSSWSLDTRLTEDSSYSINATVFASRQNVHVVWEDTRDGNYEVYYKYSSNFGSSWSPDLRLTNAWNWSRAPSLCVSGQMVHVNWADFRDGGQGEIYYKRNPTGNIGVEENAVPSLVSHLSLCVVPNPFTSFATVPGHSSDHFTLYDISGRRVGTYKGDRIGADVPQGVYFLRKLDGGKPPVRVVKVR